VKQGSAWKENGVQAWSETNHSGVNKHVARVAINRNEAGGDIAVRHCSLRVLTEFKGLLRYTPPKRTRNNERSEESVVSGGGWCVEHRGAAT
jgi:hypothetical protein